MSGTLVHRHEHGSVVPQTALSTASSDGQGCPVGTSIFKGGHIMPEHITPLEDLVGDRFVNRHEELRLCRRWVERIPLDHLNSWALAGRRRTGKTAILVKFFNHLFDKQDRVVPIFITFARYVRRPEPITYYDFAKEYFGSYLRCYLAFRYRKPSFVREAVEIGESVKLAHEMKDALAIKLCDIYEELRIQTDPAAGYSLAQWVINFPKGYAATHDMPTAIIIDEFQVLTNVYDPLQHVHHDLTDSFQWASETHWAPLLLSGSAVSLLVDAAFGGMLSGRIRPRHLRPLTREYAHDLVFRLGKQYQISITEAFAEAVYQLTGGYPYSIKTLLSSHTAEVAEFPSLEALEQVMQFELEHIDGALAVHYEWEFRKYSEVLNSGQTTRKVMFWVTKFPDEQIDVERVAKEVGVSVDEVRDSLEKLVQVDLVTRSGWTLFNGPDDPMLRRYVRYHYYREIEGLKPAEAMKDWKLEYKRLQGRMNNFWGEVAEVYVEAVMLAFDGREVDGMTHFNIAGTVTLPKFKTIERRGGIVKQGIPFEIDLTAIAPESVWIVQVKYTQDPIGAETIRTFLQQTETVITTEGYTNVTRWYFSKKGYRPDAVKELEQAGIHYSTLEQFNALAKQVGFFGLPE